MQAELAQLASPHQDLLYCPSYMDSTEQTPGMWNETQKKKNEKKKKNHKTRVLRGSVFLGEVRREKIVGEGEFFFVFSSAISVFMVFVA